MKKLAKREMIIDAALACFDKFGIDKTTMDDVAEAAHLGRMTVYRVFPSRTALIQAVALLKMEQFCNFLAKNLNPEDSFEDAFVGVALKGVALAKLDPLFFSLIENTTDNAAVKRFIVVENTEIGQVIRNLWAGILARARDRGELRPELDELEVLSWFRDVQYILLLRDDLDEAGQEHLLRTFVVPALMSSRTTLRA